MRRRSSLRTVMIIWAMGNHGDRAVFESKSFLDRGPIKVRVNDECIRQAYQQWRDDLDVGAGKSQSQLARVQHLVKLDDDSSSP